MQPQVSGTDEAIRPLWQSVTKVRLVRRSLLHAWARSDEANRAPCVHDSERDRSVLFAAQECRRAQAREQGPPTGVVARASVTAPSLDVRRRKRPSGDVHPWAGSTHRAAIADAQSMHSKAHLRGSTKHENRRAVRDADGSRSRRDRRHRRARRGASQRFRSTPSTLTWMDRLQWRSSMEVRPCHQRFDSATKRVRAPSREVLIRFHLRSRESPK